MRNKTFIDLTGKKFGRWTVIKRSDNQYTVAERWDCLCECGTEKSVIGSSLKNGTSKSCGCYCTESRFNSQRHLTHGLTGNRFYQKWERIKNRCYCKSNPRYADYGGRGIKMYEEWINSPEKFVEYVSNLPNSENTEYSLDRINNDGNYEPGNLRWADKYTQARNKRGVVLNIELIREIRELSKTLSNREIADRLGMTTNHIYAIVNEYCWVDNE